MVAINGEVHGRQRKNVSHAFSARAVEKQKGLVRGDVVLLVGRFE